MTQPLDRVLDELLVLKCQHGDIDALEQLVCRWDRRLRRHAWYLTHDPEATKDVVQDAWLEIVASIRRLKEPASFRGWAFRIVANKAADWVRRRQRQRAVSIEIAHKTCTVSDHDFEDKSETAILQTVRRAIRDLPAASQQILSMKYIDHMSTREIAHVLAIPLGTVKSRLYHARERLRQSLERNDS